MPALLRRREVALAKAVEPLQIPVPKDFKGQRTDPRDSEIMLTTGFRVLTQDEIDLVNVFLKTKNLSYSQSLVYGAVLIDPNDPLLQASHDELDEVERRAELPSTRMAKAGGLRQVTERVLIIREQGYWGNGQNALVGAA